MSVCVCTVALHTKYYISERAIGKLRSQFEKIGSHLGTKDWTRHWRSIRPALNQTKHSRTGFAPEEVTDLTAGEVFTKKYGKYFHESRIHPQTEALKEDLPTGTPVRILVKKSGFTKGAEATFSEEVFRVVGKRPTYPVTYLLEEQQNERILEPFY